MKRGTVIVAFGMTAVALGLVVWMTLVGGAQTSGPGPGRPAPRPIFPW